MEERLGAVRGAMRLENLRRAERHRQRQRAAGDALGKAEDVGRDAGLGCRRTALAGAAPAGHHLVGDEQGSVRRGDTLQLAQHAAS